jgi:hypothetical protein
VYKFCNFKGNLFYAGYALYPACGNNSLPGKIVTVKEEKRVIYILIIYRRRMAAKSGTKKI